MSFTLSGCEFEEGGLIPEDRELGGDTEQILGRVNGLYSYKKSSTICFLQRALGPESLPPWNPT